MPEIQVRTLKELAEQVAKILAMRIRFAFYTIRYQLSATKYVYINIGPIDTYMDIIEFLGDLIWNKDLTMDLRRSIVKVKVYLEDYGRRNGLCG